MSLNWISSYRITSLFPSLLILFLVLLDFVQGQWEFYNSYETLVEIQVLKLLVLIYLSLISFKSNPILFYIISSLAIVVFLGYGKKFLDIEFLRYFIKYLSPFIYYFGFKTLINSDVKKDYLFKTCTFIIYLGLLSILIGILFEVESFQTYSKRFGYKGLFKRSIDASYFIMFSILFISLFKEELKKPFLLFTLSFLCSFIIGAKLPWLFLGLYLSYLFVKNKPLRKPILLFSIPIGLLCIGVLYFLFPAKMLATYDIFSALYQEKGVFSAITSFRSDLLIEAIEYYKQQWDWKNLFFGGKELNQTLVEMSLADLILFFGIVGTILYATFYYATYLISASKKFIVLFSIVLLTSVVAGQFLFNPTVTLWFAVLAVLSKKLMKEKRMSIFLISNMYPSEKQPAYGVFVKNTVDALEQSGVVFPKKSVLSGRSKNKIIKLFRYVKYYSGIIIFSLFGKYDMVYIHFLSHNTPVLYFILKVFGKNTKWIINVHGSDVVQSEGKKIDRFNKVVLQNSDLIIVPSDVFAKRMERQYPNLETSKFYTSPSGGIDSSFFHLSQRIENKKLTLGFVSRIDSGKGWDLFLDALFQLKQNAMSFQAIMVGDGEQTEKLKQKIIDLQLENQVQYIGGLAHPELAKVYQSLDLFVFPTILDESLGLVAIEAMACGVPVIGSETLGIMSYLKHGENGFSFQLGSVEDLIHQIKNYEQLSEIEKKSMIASALKTAGEYESKKVNSKLYSRFTTLYISKE